MSADRTITIASRASKLAQVQTNWVRDLLVRAFPTGDFRTSFVSNELGDVDKSQPLYVLGGKSLWTKELEVGLVEGHVDMLVHSLKDVPTVLPPGCEIAAITEREDPVDALVVKAGLPYKSLSELPEGSVVGTGSIRRVAQLKRAFPKLAFLHIRGNIDTRLAKLDAEDGPYSAIILAKAGMVRGGIGHRITMDLGPPTLYYAVGQGALAIEIRSDDAHARTLCAALSHTPTERRCAAERACLRVLEGGCSVPVGVHTELVGETLKMTACVTGIDGQVHVEHALEATVASVEDAEALGVRMAKTLVETGAKEILDAIAEDRGKRVGEVKGVEEVAKIEASMEHPAT